MLYVSDSVVQLVPTVFPPDFDWHSESRGPSAVAELLVPCVRVTSHDHRQELKVKITGCVKGQCNMYLLYTSRWRSAGSSVRTPERTGKPVRTACTGCAEVCAASGDRQGAE